MSSKRPSASGFGSTAQTSSPARSDGRPTAANHALELRDHAVGSMHSRESFADHKLWTTPGTWRCYAGDPSPVVAMSAAGSTTWLTVSRTRTSATSPTSSGRDRRMVVKTTWSEPGAELKQGSWRYGRRGRTVDDEPPPSFPEGLDVEPALRAGCLRFREGELHPLR